MEDTGKLLNMTKNLLRKLINLAEIKLKQVEGEARLAGRKWLNNLNDSVKDAKFTMGRMIHNFGLDIVLGLQASFDDMQNPFEKPDVHKPIEELMLPPKPFVDTAFEINERMWAFPTRLVGVLQTVDRGLIAATVAVNVEKYPEADKLAQARYKYGEHRVSEAEEESGA
ncbi:hypothetical protein J4E91_002464 [Alternaria rosae]|nr:hypothetical protein J4E91_002464 [Alternaria rosae]